jgi:translocation and assembly module TamB
VQALGVWTPAGWRLAGHLQAQAKVSGTLGQPLFSGEINGQNLGAVNTLQGIELKRGQLQLQLAGSQARLTTLTFEGAGKDPGQLSISGKASLGASPEASFEITATRFHVLNRDDRQARVSGQASLIFKGLDKASLDGSLSFDQGLFDVSQADAPSIGDDVNVINLPGDAGTVTDGGTTAQTRRQWQVNLALNLGDQLRLKGRGLNARLTGALRLSTPNGRPQLKGTVKTVDGTFASYGQKLLIERGTLAFSGPLDNPRLDIKAMRVQSPLAESSDVKVGVVIGGTALDPRVSLYSEPPMSDTEKLSWLVLGRGPTGLGSADIGLLQTAASALFSGEGGTPQDSLVGSLGLDELSVRQTDGAVRDTIVTVGKQLSSRWYLGYERSLTATEGTWQALYRASQRISVRLQTGDDNAIDLIWQWRQRVPPSEAAKSQPSK